jgi:hypothetical protein
VQRAIRVDLPFENRSSSDLRRALVHSIDDRSKALEALGAEIALGDLQEIDTIRKAMEGVAAAYLVIPFNPVSLPPQ